MRKSVLIFVLSLFYQTSFAQTLTTAETIGKGKVSYFVASNALVAKDFTTLHYGYGMLVYGLSSRVDIYGGAGVTTALGQSQVNATAGANVNLWNKGVAVSSYDLLTTGVTKREDSANLLWFNTTVVSRNLKLAEKPITVYSGYSFSAPFGPGKEAKLFTPPQVTTTIPIGLVIPIKKTAMFVEYNYGTKLQTASIGFAFTP